MNRNRPYLKYLSRFIILLGILLVIIVAVNEAYNYPWGTIFTSDETYASLPDPSPIVFKDEDINSILVEKPWPNADNITENEIVNSTLPGNNKKGPSSSSYLKLGIIKIPILKLSQYVLEGTGRQLDYAVGHITGTANIGAEGNCALTGHNSSSFRYLNKLSIDDLIYLETTSVIYTYRLYDSFIVKPTEIWVLDNIESEISTLTLITCTSYSRETNRLILRARLVETNYR